MPAAVLTSSTRDEFLSDEAQSEGDLDLRVEVAEMRVLDRYREDHEGSLQWYWDGDIDATRSVELHGYRTDADGNFDEAASDDELVRRLRIVIASVVEWTIRQDEVRLISRERVGQKSATYRDAPRLPSSVFHPLRHYDETDVVGGLL